jgi:hypothetical protein
MEGMNSVDDSMTEAWAAMQAKAKAALPPEPELPLSGGGGGGTLPPMVPMKDYVDKADEALETRLDARISTLATKADITASQSNMRNNIWGAVGALFLGTLAVLSFAGDRFDSGFSMADKQEQQMQRDAAQDAASKARDQKYDEILRRLPPPKR